MTMPRGIRIIGLCAALAAGPALAATKPRAPCPTGSAQQANAELALVRAVQSARPRDIQLSITWAQLCQLSPEQRADLMFDVVARNNVPVLKALVRASLSPNQVVRVDREGEWITVTALNAALRVHEQTELAQALVDLGADANAHSIDDEPPLYTAVAMRRTGLVSRLLRAGAAPDSREAVLGGTPLMAAIAQAAISPNGLRMAEALLAHGADINRASDNGTTALMIAARLGLRSAVQWLLAKGADPSLKADDGNTHLTLLEEAAKPNSPTALAELLNTLDSALARP